MKLKAPTFMRPIFLKTIAASALAIAFITSPASAALTLSLRVTAINNTPITATQTIAANSLSVNDVLTLDLFALVTGTDANGTNDGFSLAVITMTASNTDTGVQGDLGIAAVPNPTIPNSGVASNWTTAQQLESGFAVGSVGHIGITTNTNAGSFTNRIGPTVQTSNNNTNNIYARAGAPGTFVAQTGLGIETHVYTTTFKVGTATSTIANTITMSIPTFSVSNALQYMQDNVQVNKTNPTGFVTLTGVTFVAAPEPSAFAMVALGALGLVGFRRLGFRRNS